jgi:transcription elongation factor GreA
MQPDRILNAVWSWGQFAFGSLLKPADRSPVPPAEIRFHVARVSRRARWTRRAIVEECIMSLQLTRAGREKLEEELAHLNTEKRAELAIRIQEANENGDVSDNSEFEDMKQDLVLIDARIQELQYMLEHAEIIENPSKDKVGLGSKVTIRGDDGEEETWMIVDQAEADARTGSISTESPVGSALLGKKPGETAQVKTPGGSFTYTIVSIS